MTRSYTEGGALKVPMLHCSNASCACLIQPVYAGISLPTSRTANLARGSNHEPQAIQPPTTDWFKVKLVETDDPVSSA
jgi:hypothetical protein